MKETIFPVTSMTDFEILQSYKEAKDKRKQITILADLNNTTEGWIRRILTEKCKIDGRALPRAKREKPIDHTSDQFSEKEKTAGEILFLNETAKPKNGTVLVDTVNHIKDILDNLKDQKRYLLETITQAQQKLKEVEKALSIIGAAEADLLKA